MQDDVKTMELAIRCHHSGQMDRASEICRTLLQTQPQHAQALHLLGLIAFHRGDLAAARDFMEQAISVEPKAAEFHANLGTVLRELNCAEEALQAYSRAIALRSDYAEAYSNLGSTLQDLGRLDEAIVALKTATVLQPGNAEFHNNLAAALQAQQKIEEAATAYAEAARLSPAEVDFHRNLGQALTLLGRHDRAAATFATAATISFDDAEIQLELGQSLRRCQRLPQARVALARAIALREDYTQAYVELAWVLIDLLEDRKAAELLYKGLQQCNNGAEMHHQLGFIHGRAGRIEQALAEESQAIALDPDNPTPASIRLFFLQNDPRMDAPGLLRECRAWNDKFAKPLARLWKPRTNDRSPQRRLRVGYVSADFRGHPVARFMRPLLQNHDRSAVEIYCYSDVEKVDAVTEELRGYVQHWRETRRLSDQQLAQKVGEDGIDILVDLTLHAANNRLLMFARKPAPVQVCYLGYPATTGLDAMDYRLTDPYIDPPGENDANYSEISIRLPQTHWCYGPLLPPEEVSPLPAMSVGRVTFGCLNSPSKLGGGVLELWVQILQRLPSARLILHAIADSQRQRIVEFFQHRQIESRRLEFIGFLDEREYLKTYNRIDIALDPFPYTGATTTCDALWMGVPVVTLRGDTGVGRSCTSILSNAGLPQWIAATPQHYVDIAVAGADDLLKVESIRRSLRANMRASALMDAPRFAHDIEAAYRQMWLRWLGQAMPH